MREIFIILLILSACSKPTKPIEVKSIGIEDFKKLERIEENLIEYRSSKDRNLILATKIEVNQYLSQRIVNKEFLSRLWALKAEIAYLENDPKEFEIAFKNIKEKIPQIYLLKNWAEKDNEKKLSILLDAENEYENNPRIKLEIGLLYFEKEEYSKAFVYLDEALQHLPYTYKKVYGEKREISLKLKDIGKSSRKKWLTINKIKLQDLLNIINSETTLLKIYNISKIENKNLVILFDEKVLPSNISLDKDIEKKDLIYIIFRLMEKNNYKDVANFYRKFPLKYREKSPIKDLSPTDFFYEAALYFVKREILDLPDGKNLYPALPISGKELFDVIEKIKKIR